MSERQSPVGSITDSIVAISKQPEEWQAILRDLVVSLTAEGQSTLANEVQTLSTSLVAQLGVTGRCTADFLARKASFGLKELIGQGDEKRPALCRPNPAIIDMDVHPDRLNHIEIDGYNMDVGMDAVRIMLVDEMNKRTDVTDNLTVASPYLWILDLGANGVPLNDQSDKIEIVIDGQIAGGIEVVQPLKRPHAQVLSWKGLVYIYDAGAGRHLDTNSVAIGRRGGFGEHGERSYSTPSSNR